VSLVENLVEILKALSDESRLRILGALAEGERCVCQIVALIDLAPSTISRHLAILRAAGLIRCRKSGRWIHYRLADPSGDDVTRRTVAWIREVLAREPRIGSDREAMAEILRKDPEDLCRAEE
jgi:DNA-binding transcriptional ArsR family regulator